MDIKKFTIWILLVFVTGCAGSNNANNSEVGTTQSDSRKQRLPSGQEIVLTSINGINFENGENALILNYQTKIPIEKHDELKNEVQEVWEIFRYDVEKAGTTAGVIRATHIEEDGFIVKSGKGYGFIYKRDEKGGWYLNEDNK